MEDAPLMLQSLLADRFKLVDVRRESHEQDVSALVVGKGGPKLKQSLSVEPQNPDDTKGESPVGAGQVAPRKKDHSYATTNGTLGLRFVDDPATSSTRMETTSLTMADLALVLQMADAGNGRLVVDMTGLQGSFEMVLDIPVAALRASVAPGAGVPNANPQEPGPAETASDPGIGPLLRKLKSFGLELENRKALVEHLIVEHVHTMPTEN
jgi:uncharacterized protein (TIGR03435 family)